MEELAITLFEYVLPVTDNVDVLTLVFACTVLVIILLAIVALLPAILLVTAKFILIFALPPTYRLVPITTLFETNTPLDPLA